MYGKGAEAGVLERGVEDGSVHRHYWEWVRSMRKGDIVGGHVDGVAVGRDVIGGWDRPRGWYTKVG